ncbi:MAG: hypothetical protein GDA45_01870 [Chromatiales bacterium]|nr:hypothetical protein [Chromatiales bacterium]
MRGYEAQINRIDHGVLKLQLCDGGVVLNYQTVLSLWKDSEVFRSFYIRSLASIDYIAYRWETPPLTTETLYQPFECVLVDSPELAITADASAFSDYFDNAHSQESIVTFSNLGGDAWMVVPCPKATISTYSHLAVFTRHAPDYQQHALWQQVAKLVGLHISSAPLWLNTAGGGVAWLHVRLDSRPKYYCYSPYKTMHPLR